MSGIGPVGPGEEYPLFTMDPNACYNHGEFLLARGLDLAPDSVGVPAPAVDPELSLVQRENTQFWLPEGHHWDLHIEHDHRVTTGPFVEGEWAWLWHITVSPWNTVDAMRNVLHDKAAEVNFVIGGRSGAEHPIVIQCLGLNEFGKGLVHLAGHAETNRRRLIQVEVCATVDDIAHFNDWHYRALANLYKMCTHRPNPRVPVANRLARSFANDNRFTEAGYKRVKGHHGHRHAPENDHDDPTRKFNGTKIVKFSETAPHQL